jgi:hypothetical protein
MTSKSDALLISCADGRSKKPKGLRDEHWVHTIRLPGGILFPDFCAHSHLGRGQTFAMSTPIDYEIERRLQALIATITPETGLIVGELVLLLSIKTMFDLKRPKKIILGYHTHCGAAETIGLDEVQIQTKHHMRQAQLRQYYPGVAVTILRERHSECGEHHHGHEEVIIDHVHAV